MLFKNVKNSFQSLCPYENIEKYNWFELVRFNEYSIYIGELKGSIGNNAGDVILIKQYSLEYQNSYINILKQIFFSIFFKQYSYFEKINDILFDKNQNLYLVITSNYVSLKQLIYSKVFEYKKEEGLIKWVIYQITYSLYILHFNKIIHGTLIPSSISINNFGHIFFSNMSSFSYFGENLQSYDIFYCPPEFLIDSTKVDEKFDMWCLGVLILELYCKESPIFYSDKIKDDKEAQLHYLLYKLGIFKSYSIEELKQKLKNNENIKFKIDDKILEKIDDKDAKELVQNLIVFNPRERYSVEQVLKSNYLKKYLDMESMDIEKAQCPFTYTDVIQNNIDQGKFLEITKKLINATKV